MPKVFLCWNEIKLRHGKIPANRMLIKEGEEKAKFEAKRMNHCYGAGTHWIEVEP